ncbi:Serine carboxypeptidase 1-like protein, partial [Drosera capensis]
FSLLVFCCCQLASVGATNANGQAHNLFRLVESKNPPNTDPWVEVDLVDEDMLDIDDEDWSMKADKISALPGQPKGVKFNQYAGYVRVDKKTGKTLFYYFVQSPKYSEDLPLVLWLNGGLTDPGCSSLGNEAFEEQGPVRVNSDGRTLYLNPYAWNKVANVIFLESPAVVGFSYPNSSIIYNETGDKSTARDACRFLLRWLHRFPHYKSRDFYISGESFAGHYVPELAYTVIHHNDNVRNHTKINLKGIIFGNGVLNNPTDSRGRFDYLWSHALISDRTHAGRNKFGGISLYNIYYPLCITSPSFNRSIAGSIDHYDPCSDCYVNDYLNNSKVQAALHAKPANWSSCSTFNWTDSPNSVLPIVQKLISSTLRVWIYSGGVDGVVPITSTRYSIDSLKLPVKTHWRAWYLNQEVGSYVEEYENLTFATVKGEGHEVPSYQPQRALALFSA